MGNNRKANEFDNVGDNSSPPPYEEINIDEFGSDKSQVRHVAPLNPTNNVSSVATPLPNSLSCPTSSNQGINAGDNFQNDFFKKPPKFLLYPSTSMSEDGSRGEREKEFDDKFVPCGQQPSTRENQTSKNGSPQVFAVPQAQNNANGGGLPMSALQLTQQVNVPVQGHITDNYLPRHSQGTVCPNCKVAVQSEMQYVSGQLTHLVALAACWFTCCLACVPYFIDELKDVEHFCPQCRTILGYNRKKVF